MLMFVRREIMCRIGVNRFNIDPSFAHVSNFHRNVMVIVPKKTTD